MTSMVRTVSSTVFAVCLFVNRGSVATLLAQQNTIYGTVKGTVIDNTGAVMPSVRVTAINEETGEQHSTTTHPDGEYSIPVSSGTYTVRVAAQGYKTSKCPVYMSLLVLI